MGCGASRGAGEPLASVSVRNPLPAGQFSGGESAFNSTTSSLHALPVFEGSQKAALEYAYLQRHYAKQQYETFDAVKARREDNSISVGAGLPDAAGLGTGGGMGSRKGSRGSLAHTEGSVRGGSRRGTGPGSVGALLGLGGGPVSVNALTDHEFEVTLEMMRNDAVGAQLRLEHQKLGTTRIRRLAMALRANSSLVACYLSDTSLGPEGAAALEPALRGPTPQQATGGSGQSRSRITSWHLDRNALGPAGAALISASLRANPLMTELRLQTNELGPDGTQALASALQGHPTLRTLDLAGNAIGAAGCEHVASCLLGPPAAGGRLAWLDLHDNDLDANAAAHLATALGANVSLVELHLQGNRELGAAGAAALAGALRENASLEVLRLDGCNIGPAGAGALLSALRDSNGSLLQMYIGPADDPDISAATCAELAACLDRNRALRALPADARVAKLRADAEAATLAAQLHQRLAMLEASPAPPSPGPSAEGDAPTVAVASGPAAAAGG